MKHWTRTNRRTLIKDRWLTLYADDCLLPNGVTITPYYVMDEKEWVHIVAVDSQGLVLVTRQYRYATNVICAELPCGAAEEDELPLNAAKRELKEETGFEAADWSPLGVMYANPARQTNRIHCYLARELHDSGHRTLDISEDIAFKFMSLPEIKRMIHSGEFGQALHIASFFLAAEHLNQPTTQKR
ncbi:MAG: NUDIX hydrolase [Opitutae bacterium]|nr:NUDIX hydrolase [Opitutae bacterium]